MAHRVLNIQPDRKMEIFFTRHFASSLFRILRLVDLEKRHVVVVVVVIVVIIVVTSSSSSSSGKEHLK
ncbi:hypothetical protein ElyMa_005610600 [Elysia marginata]|uniref:Transmembrane protein n=1 Tax=Elysia marginata TaxID=1093978 RepID=A0AAV4F578_9GAST|nr:hypothetical protein ElyMa_005610600 [Elysia marginata]